VDAPAAARQRVTSGGRVRPAPQDLAACALARPGHTENVRQSLPDGRRPVLRHPGYAVRRILELTGLDADCEILAAGCEIEAGQEHRDRFTTP
jgi:hypothetical protein